MLDSKDFYYGISILILILFNVAQYIVSQIKKSEVKIKDRLQLDKEKLYEGLTPREKELFGMFAQGLKANEIADRMHISENTVNTHRKKIYSKIQVDSVNKLIALAYELNQNKGNEKGPLPRPRKLKVTDQRCTKGTLLI